MKIKILLISALVVFLSACTQTTCPTYTKGSLDKEKLERIKREKV